MHYVTKVYSRQPEVKLPRSDKRQSASTWLQTVEKVPQHSRKTRQDKTRQTKQPNTLFTPNPSHVCKSSSSTSQAATTVTESTAAAEVSIMCPLESVGKTSGASSGYNWTAFAWRRCPVNRSGIIGTTSRPTCYRQWLEARYCRSDAFRHRTLSNIQLQMQMQMQMQRISPRLFEDLPVKATVSKQHFWEFA